MNQSQNPGASPSLLQNVDSNLSQMIVALRQNAALTIQKANQEASVFNKKADDLERNLSNGFANQPQTPGLVVKRGPGRPPKTQTATAAVSGQPAARRGRPPGSKNKTTATVTSDTENQPRRGRPPGSKNKTTTAVAATATSSEKRRPGRPKGSKNGDVTTAKTVTKTGKRPKNREPLEVFVLRTICENPQAELDIDTVVKGVRKLGYKSTANNFANMVYQKLQELTAEKHLLTKKQHDGSRTVYFQSTPEAVQQLQKLTQVEQQVQPQQPEVTAVTMPTLIDVTNPPATADSQAAPAGNGSQAA